MTVSTHELSIQEADMLPAREALQDVSADIDLTNYAPALSFGGNANAEASQNLVLLQKAGG
jgi:hypothetical protein